MIALTASVLIAAGQPGEFHAAFGMEQGAVYRLTAHNYRVADGKVTKDGRAEYDLVYEGPDADGALLVRARQLETPEITAGAAAMGLQPADLLPECEFLIDEDWAVTLRNWEQLGAQLRDATGRMYAHRVAQGLLTQEKADAASGMMRQLTATHEGVLGVHGKLVLPYLTGYGYTLAEGEPIEAPCEVPNPFGGEPLAAVETAELRDDPHTAEIEYGLARVIGPEALEGLIRSVIASAGLEGEEFEAEIAEELENAQLTSTLEWAWQDGLVRRGRSESVWRMRYSGDVFEEVRWEVEREGNTR